MTQQNAVSKRQLYSLHQGPSAANKRKREKRKAKAEQRAAAEAASSVKVADNASVAPEKAMKRKVIPAKATVTDEKGENWEVVQVKKTVMVEDSDTDADFDEESKLQ